MIRTNFTDGGAFERIMGRLSRYRDIDLAPLAATIGQIVQQDIAAGIAAGTTTDGDAFAPLAESTLRNRRGRDETPGGGPDSSFVRDLIVDIQPDVGGFSVVLGWRGQTATKARFFTSGTSRQPARNIQGLRPESRERIRAAMRDFLAQLGRN